MGGSQSAPQHGVPVKGEAPSEQRLPDGSVLPAGHFGVSVTGAPVDHAQTLDKKLEDMLKEAYENGKNDGKQEFDSLMNQAAMEVYENTQMQIKSFQSAQIEEANALAEKVASRLTPPPALQQRCGAEDASLLACLQSNKGSPFPACAALVSQLEACSSKAVQKLG
jgi:hypothetical protein